MEKYLKKSRFLNPSKSKFLGRGVDGILQDTVVALPGVILVLLSMSSSPIELT